MKSYTLRFRAADRAIFEDLLSGKKKVETRAASVRYKNMHVGDEIVLVCEKDKEKRTIKKVTIFKTIPELIKKYKVSDIAPGLKTREELEKLYASFGGYSEKIRQFGLIAIELE